MPLILGTNSIKETGYDVANSARFDDGSSDNIQRTYGTPTNSKIYALSWWVKLSTDPTVGAAGHDLWGERADKDNRVFMGLNGTGQFDFFEKSGGSSVLELKTNRLFRDVGAWYHFLLLGDSTQSTASNRIKLYINGVQETSFATETYPSQNYDFRLAINTTKYFARTGLGGSGLSTNYLEGYLAEAVFVDGTVTAHTDYGEFDEDSPNIWKPKDVSGLTFGNNGFYLDFENASSLGADVSGNGNNFTVNNLTSIDQTTDTCTNNWNTLNGLYTASNLNYSQGNTQINAGADGWFISAGTIGIASGKFYFEIECDTLGSGTYSSESMKIGIINSEDINDGSGEVNQNNGNHYQSDGNSGNNGSLSGVGNFATYTNGDIIGVAVDMDNRKIYYHKNGTYINSGNPSTGSNGFDISSSYDFVLPCVSMYESGTIAKTNFGTSYPDSVSSGNSDANGYGNFEYSVPTGFYSINTKNLAEFG